MLSFSVSVCPRSVPEALRAVPSALLCQWCLAGTLRPLALGSGHSDGGQCQLCACLVSCRVVLASHAHLFCVAQRMLCRFTTRHRHMATGGSYEGSERCKGSLYCCPDCKARSLVMGFPASGVTYSVDTFTGHNAILLATVGIPERLRPLPTPSEPGADWII